MTAMHLSVASPDRLLILLGYVLSALVRPLMDPRGHAGPSWAFGNTAALSVLACGLLWGRSGLAGAAGERS
jgi:hypothetical protein